MNACALRTDQAILEALRTIPGSAISAACLRLLKCATTAGSIGIALAQDRVPGQTRLRAFEDQEFEQRRVVVLWDAPLAVVILDVKRIARPRAAHDHCRNTPAILSLRSSENVIGVVCSLNTPV